MKKPKALVLYSGGLDSMLAVKMLEAQGIEAVGVCFGSVFFGCEKARASAEKSGLELRVIDISEEILALVKNPPSGYGKNLNPCIDCHALMIQKAAAMMDELGANILATGEVLGQRPFSQNKEALARIEEMAGVEILRPLSAKVLPETSYEKDGLVTRGRLGDIRGRSRDRQMELVEKYNIDGFASPAGGCLLTDPEFSERIARMLDWWPVCGINDVELLKRGRVFWFYLARGEKALLIIGRNHEENEELAKLCRPGDILIELKDIMGPTSLVRNLKGAGENKEIELDIPENLKLGELDLLANKEAAEIIKIASLLTGYYAVKARGKNVKLMVQSKKL